MSLRESPLPLAPLEANHPNARKSFGPRPQRGKRVARACSFEPALIPHSREKGPRLFRVVTEEPQTLKNRSALRVFLRTKPLTV
jgi:hypothetical protein